MATETPKRTEPSTDERADKPPPADGGKLWVTDTLGEMNGIGRTVATVASLATRRGRDVTVLTCLERPPETDFAVRNVLPLIEMPRTEDVAERFAIPSPSEVRDEIEAGGYTELILSTPGPLGLASLDVARHLGLGTVGIYHGDFPTYVRRLTGNPDLEEHAWKYLRWFLGELDVVYAPSFTSRRQLVARGVPAERLRLIPRGVDTRLFHPGRRDASFWSRWDLPDDGLKLLYVGKMTRTRHLDELIDAFGAYLDGGGGPAHLVLVGDGPYARELAASPPRPEVVLAGTLEGKELARAYASADLFVFPGTSGTFGHAVLEALASGLPVVVSDQGAPQEIVRRRGSGVVVPAGDREALERAIRELADDPDRRADLARRALSTAHSASWTGFLERLWEDHPRVARPARGTAPDPALRAAAT